MRVEPQDNYDHAAGTSLQGYVQADYYEMTRAFGQPLGGDGYKSRVQWVVVFTDLDDVRTVATIYDWKSDVAVSNVAKWNVGGTSPQAVQFVNDYLNYMWDMMSMEDDLLPEVG